MSDAGGSSSSNSSLDSAVAPPPSPVKGDKQHTNSRMSKTSAILRYSHQNAAAAVRRLLEEDPSFVSVRDDDSRTPLHVAAFHGSIDVAKTLIEFGAEINAQDRWQNTDQNESHFEAPELDFSISSLLGTVFNDMIEALFGFLSNKLVLVCIAWSILTTSVQAKPSEEEYAFYKSLIGWKGILWLMGLGLIAACFRGAWILSGKCANYLGDRWFGDPEIPISTGPRRTRSWMRGWKNPLQRPITKYFNPVFASQELHDKLF